MLTKALGWSVFSSAAGIVTQVALMAVLSRLLGPTEFGLMAAAQVALRFVSGVAQFGLGPALIQRSEIEPGHQSAAFATALGLGLTCWLAFAACAGVVASFFREPDLHDVLLITPAGLLLSSLASVPQSLLRRGLRFKVLAGIELFALIAGYGAVTVALAVMGHGVWSLVFGTIAQQGILLAGSALAARVRPFVTTTRQHFRDLFQYGARYSLTGFLEYLSANVEIFFASRIFGTEKLGFYNRAQAVTVLPVQQLMSAVSRVAFPAYANLRNADSQLRESVLLSLHMSTLLVLPVACGICVAAGPLVTAVLGLKWSGSIPVVRVIAWCLPAMYISLFVGTALDTMALFRGKTIQIVIVMLAKLALMLALMGHGLVGMSIAVMIAEWGRALGMMTLIRRPLGIRMRDLLTRMRHGVAVAALVGILIWLVAEGAGHWFAQLHVGAVLTAQFIVGALAYFSATWFCLRSVVKMCRTDVIDVGKLRRFAGMST